MNEIKPAKRPFSTLGDNKCEQLKNVKRIKVETAALEILDHRFIHTQIGITEEESKLLNAKERAFLPLKKIDKKLRQSLEDNSFIDVSLLTTPEVILLATAAIFDYASYQKEDETDVKDVESRVDKIFFYGQLDKYLEPIKDMEGTSLRQLSELLPKSLQKRVIVLDPAEVLPPEAFVEILNYVPTKGLSVCKKWRSLAVVAPVFKKAVFAFLPGNFVHPRPIPIQHILQKLNSPYLITEITEFFNRHKDNIVASFWVQRLAILHAVYNGFDYLDDLHEFPFCLLCSDRRLAAKVINEMTLEQDIEFESSTPRQFVLAYLPRAFVINRFWTNPKTQEARKARAKEIVSDEWLLAEFKRNCVTFRERTLQKLKLHYISSLLQGHFPLSEEELKMASTLPTPMHLELIEAFLNSQPSLDEFDIIVKLFQSSLHPNQLAEGLTQIINRQYASTYQLLALLFHDEMWEFLRGIDQENRNALLLAIIRTCSTCDLIKFEEEMNGSVSILFKKISFESWMQILNASSQLDGHMWVCYVLLQYIIQKEEQKGSKLILPLLQSINDERFSIPNFMKSIENISKEYSITLGSLVFTEEFWSLYDTLDSQRFNYVAEFLAQIFTNMDVFAEKIKNDSLFVRRIRECPFELRAILFSLPILSQEYRSLIMEVFGLNETN